MIIHLAWKNIWRNKTRSLVLVGAIFFGALSGLFTVGLMNGWIGQRIEAVINTEAGSMRLSDAKFSENSEVTLPISDINAVENYLDHTTDIKSYSKHTEVFAMASTARGSVGVTLVGIDPQQERNVSNLYTKIIPNGGDFFESNVRKNPSIVLSERVVQQLKLENFRVTEEVVTLYQKKGVPASILSKLASIKGKRYLTLKKFKSKLKEIITQQEQDEFGKLLIDGAKYIKLGSRIVFAFTDINGELVYQTFSLSGVYQTSNLIFDNTNAFVASSVLNPLLQLVDNQAHTVVIRVDENADLQQVRQTMAEHFPQDEVLTWQELAPDAGMLDGFMTFYNYIIIGFIFSALAFGIINTMLMSILERVHELGMLMAIGMKKKRVFVMIMLETLFVTLTGTLTAMVAAWGIIGITGKTGINFSGAQEGLESLGWSSIVYPSLPFDQYVGITILVMIIAIFASLYPAKRALKINPIEAIREG